MAKPKTKVRGMGWSDDEMRFMYALVETGATLSTIAAGLNEIFPKPTQYERTISGVSNARVRYKRMQKQVTDADRKLAQTFLTKHVSTDPAKRKSNGNGNGHAPAPSAVPPDAVLSPKAQKVLEARLEAHRFRLETPDASIEVAVSGKNAPATFKKIVDALHL